MEVNMDDFGDRMKMYEMMEAGRKFIPMLPIYARIDGRSFSSFTRGMNRPYDMQMTNCMVETTRYLVEETNAIMGYTQSDEISLAWFSNNIDSQVFFDGRVQKMTSTLAAMASVKFFSLAQLIWANKTANVLPTFDCRVFQLPNKIETANVFLWRERDATKNAISMAARSMFSHKALHAKSGSEMQEMMFSEHGVNFNDYPAFFKRGTFVQRKKVMRELTVEELERIPVHHRPSGPIERRTVLTLDMPSFSKVLNRVDVIFEGAEPITSA
jgi:tRNA(His) guanylyltransferase